MAQYSYIVLWLIDVWTFDSIGISAVRYKSSWSKSSDKNDFYPYDQNRQILNHEDTNLRFFWHTSTMADRHASSEVGLRSEYTVIHSIAHSSYPIRISDTNINATWDLDGKTSRAHVFHFFFVAAPFSIYKQCPYSEHAHRHYIIRMLSSAMRLCVLRAHTSTNLVQPKMYMTICDGSFSYHNCYLDDFIRDKLF